MAKADTMLGILMLLRARKKMTARQLADQLEIHIRTVYRCIDALCISGVPIVSETGRDGGYYIPDHVKLDPLFFDADEQKALLHAAQFARESGYPYEEALNRAVDKIKRYADAEQADRLEAAGSYLEVIHPAANAGLADALSEIEKAIESQTALHIRYAAGYEGSGSGTERTFNPYGIVNWKDKWYAVGFCQLRSDIRSFRVDRIRRIRRTDIKFRRPDGFSAGGFLLDSLLPDMGAEAQSNGQLISVRIEGNPQALDDLCRHWLFSRTLVERTADSARFRLDEQSLYVNTPHYLLSFGSAIRIAEPPELNDCLADIAESLHHYYRSSGKH